jgi:hypothetical protein
VFLFPALLLGVAIARGLARGEPAAAPSDGAAARSWKVGAGARLAAGIVVVAVLARLAGGAVRA